MRYTVDGYLSRKAMATWPRSLVFKLEDGSWWLRRVTTTEGVEVTDEVCLADVEVPPDKRFGAARSALEALRRTWRPELHEERGR